MRVAYDSQIFIAQEYGGISRYFCSLTEKLSNIKGVETKIFAPFYINSYLDRLPRMLVSGHRIPKIPKTSRFFQFSGSRLARYSIKNYVPQLVHETYYARKSSAPKDVPVVLTVHDMIHELYPSSFSSRDHTSFIKKQAILRADHIICISEHTRRDLLEFIPIAPEKVSVVYHGFDQFSSPSKYEELKPVLSAIPFLLFVGQRHGYKNFVGLLWAYASSDWLMQNFRIICVGGGKLKIDELKLMHELEISVSQVEQISADDTLLTMYYRNAAAFVYPSMYEGFGIPPLEAMSLNCPVVCSNVSSIPEVVGDAGEYFDPQRIDSMRSAIERVLQDSERRNHLIKKGSERCSFFSWQRCASETLSIYRSLI